ncbi:unnamed protein product [Moneuplotes crassus]|uniref:Uncharacterized protein n=1 Tax=Euplotes crassus TaxID=5936 RepID=A0AAD1XPY0_EUPCR|nr:unnamed protein product [Moneuplotes crassus]
MHRFYMKEKSKPGTKSYIPGGNRDKNFSQDDIPQDVYQSLYGKKTIARGIRKTNLRKLKNKSNIKKTKKADLALYNKISSDFTEALKNISEGAKQGEGTVNRVQFMEILLHLGYLSTIKHPQNIKEFDGKETGGQMDETISLCWKIWDNLEGNLQDFVKIQDLKSYLCAISNVNIPKKRGCKKVKSPKPKKTTSGDYRSCISTNISPACMDMFKRKIAKEKYTNKTKSTRKGSFLSKKKLKTIQKEFSQLSENRNKFLLQVNQTPISKRPLYVDESLGVVNYTIQDSSLSHEGNPENKMIQNKMLKNINARRSKMEHDSNRTSHCRESVPYSPKSTYLFTPKQKNRLFEYCQREEIKDKSEPEIQAQTAPVSRSSTLCPQNKDDLPFVVSPEPTSLMLAKTTYMTTSSEDCKKEEEASSSQGADTGNLEETKALKTCNSEADQTSTSMDTTSVVLFKPFSLKLNSASPKNHLEKLKMRQKKEEQPQALNFGAENSCHDQEEHLNKQLEEENFTHMVQNLLHSSRDYNESEDSGSEQDNSYLEDCIETNILEVNNEQDFENASKTITENNLSLEDSCKDSESCVGFTKSPYLYIDVTINNKEIHSIPICEGDCPIKLTNEFAEKHSLLESAKEKLLSLIKSQIVTGLSKIEEVENEATDNSSECSYS